MYVQAPKEIPTVIPIKGFTVGAHGFRCSQTDQGWNPRFTKTLATIPVYKFLQAYFIPIQMVFQVSWSTSGWLVFFFDGWGMRVGIPLHLAQIPGGAAQI
jgi:hypothetical protein